MYLNHPNIQTHTYTYTNTRLHTGALCASATEAVDSATRHRTLAAAAVRSLVPDAAAAVTVAPPDVARAVRAASALMLYIHIMHTIVKTQ